MKKILSLIMMTLLVEGSVIAKDKESLKHEVSFYGAAGLASIKYNTQDGDTKNGFGSSLGIAGNFYFTKKWSILTGAEVSSYKQKISAGNYTETYNTNDGQYNFEFRTTVSNYEEIQNATFLNIPVMLQYQLPVAKENSFYVVSGLKFGIPIKSNYKIVNASMKNSGFYPIWSNEEDLILDTQEFMGFGNFNRKNMKGDLGLKVAYLFSLETGMKWKLNKSLSLYSGAFLDYGLNDIKEGNSKYLVQYNTEDPENFINNSILQSNLTDKAALLAIGVKFRLAMGLK